VHVDAGRIVGGVRIDASIAGADAGELIAECVLLATGKPMKLDELASAIHVSPTGA